MPRSIPDSYRPFVARRTALPSLLALVLAIAFGGVFAAAGHAALPLDQPFGAVATNPADRLVDLPLDDMGYDRATHCVKGPTAGALALVKELPKFSPRGQFWGIMRCEKWGKGSASLHAEGRAIDWHLDVHDRADRADAEGLIRLLLAPDASGEPFALARRLGVQGIIWDCRSWWGGDSLGRYSACMKNGKWNKKVDDTTAHRDHVHLELNKAGAKLRTSWWTQGPGQKAAKAVR
ncbi:MAG: hypothetical protein Q7T55_22095 [Solirubrobacteraceae bacterium]|nr:hypothetical protein [Solirubrobacteraceae bacterium]